METLQYMVSPQGRNTWTVDDLVPYVDKLAIISEEQERVTEPVSHGPASEREFPAPEFHILQSSVETRGLGRRREPVYCPLLSATLRYRVEALLYFKPCGVDIIHANDVRTSLFLIFPQFFNKL